MRGDAGPLPLSEGGRWVMALFVGVVFVTVVLQFATRLGLGASVGVGVFVGLGVAVASALVRGAL